MIQMPKGSIKLQYAELGVLVAILATVISAWQSLKAEVRIAVRLGEAHEMRLVEAEKVAAKMDAVEYRLGAIQADIAAIKRHEADADKTDAKQDAEIRSLWSMILAVPAASRESQQ